MSVYMSAAAGPVEGVGGCPQTHGGGSDDRPDDVDGFGVAPFGGFFPFAGFAGEVVDDVDQVTGFVFVEPVEGTHAHRVTPISLRDVWHAVWLTLPRYHRDVLAAAVTVGCLFFMVLGACLR
jgi:hypothetical protein